VHHSNLLGRGGKDRNEKETNEERKDGIRILVTACHEISATLFFSPGYMGFLKQMGSRKMTK